MAVNEIMINHILNRIKSIKTVDMDVMYQSIPSLTIPPSPGIRTFQLPQGSGFRSSACPGVCPGGGLKSK